MTATPATYHPETRRCTMARHRELFYHFTCRLWWRFVEKEDIRHGEVPIGGRRFLDHPNLTVDPEPANQGWACTAGQCQPGGSERIVWVVSKLAVRIGVELESRDPMLIRWVDLARQTGMDERTIRLLDARGGGQMPIGGSTGASSDRDSSYPSISWMRVWVPAVEQQFIEATRTSRTSKHARDFLRDKGML